MIIKTSNTLAVKAAAIVGGLALVLTSFAPAARAQSTADLQAQLASLLAQLAALQAQITGGSATAAPFTRDLTIGSTGADVTSLQNWLISKGYSIPAGATGYFGTQTRAAVASYQAANAIAPAAGYFGPITRSNVNAKLAVTPSTPGGSDTDDDRDDLRGGEADLSGFELNREESSGAENEEEVEVATLEFDVEDGDVRIERLELVASSTDASHNQQPWRYFDRAIIKADGREIADMDVDSRSDWREVGDDAYRITFTGLDHIVREDETAELTIAFDIGDIDSDDLQQQFAFYIPDRGIRAVDSAGIQQYIGDADETVTFGFTEEESGDLRIRRNSDNPEMTTLISDEDRESDEYTVFIFDIENNDDVDAMITDLVIRVESSEDADDVIRRATLHAGREDYTGDITADAIEFDDIDFEIGGDEEETFELEIRLARNAPDTTLRFALDGDTDVTAEGVRSGDESTIRGSASSEIHTVAVTGIEVRAISTEAKSNDGQTIGTFRVTFEVTALEEDAYIYQGAGAGDNDLTPFSELASTTGIAYTVFQGGTASTTVSGDSAILQSGADTDGDYFVIREGDTERFTLSVSLDPQTATTDLYHIALSAIRFDDEADSGTADDAVYLIPNAYDFQTKVVPLQGS